MENNDVKVTIVTKAGEVTEGYLSGRIYNRSGEGINSSIEDLLSDLKDSGFASVFDIDTGNLVMVIPVSNISQLIPN